MGTGRALGIQWGERGDSPKNARDAANGHGRGAATWYKVLTSSL